MRPAFPIAACAFALLTCWQFPAAAAGDAIAAPAASPIYLQSRTFVPEPGLREDDLTRMLAQPDARVHFLLQLAQVPSEELRQKIESYGVRLLKYLPRDAYIASAAKDEKLLRALAAAEGVRWIGALMPEDKMTWDLIAGKVSPWTHASDGRVRLLVRFHADVSVEEAGAALKNAGVKPEGAVRSLNAYAVTLPWQAIGTLARSDAVKWIDQLPAGGEDDNQGSRIRIGAQAAQGAPMNLDGGGIAVGQWESGNADATHDDFGPRVTVGDAIAAISSHATHVAGTVLGSGVLSAGTERGIAPAASIVSFRRPLLAGALDVATLETQYDNAIDNAGIRLSTNSWGTSHCDQVAGTCYDNAAGLYDEIVRGSLGNRISIVASAGNRGDDVTPNWGTVRVPNSAKNTIVVAATYSDTDLATDFSSRGPVDDGRLKPDIAAPGDENEDGLGDCSGRMIRSTLPGDIYGENCGTSMATPAVAGAAALLIERWRNELGVAAGDPWPSSVKALMIHTAVDRGNTGPDYTYGYGRLDVRAAAQMIRRTPIATAAVIQDTIEATGRRDSYRVFVPPSPLAWWLPRPVRLKATLVWDDAPGDPALARGAAQLVNNLDLSLVSPTGAVLRPWILDPANPGNAASTGVDNLNVVEKAEVKSPASGWWTIRVRGGAVPEGLQNYSLVYEVVYSNPVFDPCIFGPRMCLPPESMFPGGLVLECPERGCVIFDPLPQNCLVKWGGHCPGCGPNELCPPLYTITLDNVRDWHIHLIDSKGEKVPFKLERTALGAARLSFQPDKTRYVEGEIGQYIIAFELGDQGKVGQRYKVTMQLETNGKPLAGAIAQPLTGK
jgi:hypothetical protein